jgi:lactoylglutathione lyase
MAGPTKPRLTHVAMPASDIDRSIAWYERFTPLRLLDRREEPTGSSCWLAAPEPTDQPFVLVLVSYAAYREKPRPVFYPFAHIGIELPSRNAVEAIAELAKANDCLKWPVRDMPAPVGYVCAATDPDGNLVEFSHNQGIYDALIGKWGVRD